MREITLYSSDGVSLFKRLDCKGRRLPGYGAYLVCGLSKWGFYVRCERDLPARMKKEEAKFRRYMEQ